MTRFPSRLRLASLVSLMLLFCLSLPARAAFTFAIMPSDPATSGALVVLPGDNVIATNLGISTVSDGVTTVAFNQRLDLSTVVLDNFFALAGPVEQFGGTTPFAYGLGGSSTVSPFAGGVPGEQQLVMTGLVSSLGSDLATVFGVDPATLYRGTLTLDFVVNPALAGAQVIDGSIVLDAIRGGVGPGGTVPEPSSFFLASVGFAGCLLLKIRK